MRVEGGREGGQLAAPSFREISPDPPEPRLLQLGGGHRRSPCASLVWHAPRPLPCIMQHRVATLALAGRQPRSTNTATMIHT